MGGLEELMGKSWFYTSGGTIYHRPVVGVDSAPIAIQGSVPSIYCLQSVNDSNDSTDTVTIVVKDCQLIFQVNGVDQGTPIDLPKNTKVALAVSLYSTINS